MRFDRFSKIEQSRLNQKNWDRASVMALHSPKGLKKLDSSVLLIRPSNSFVAPLWAINPSNGVNILTMKKADHNLHHSRYADFFEALKKFAFTEISLPEKAFDVVLADTL